MCWLTLATNWSSVSPLSVSPHGQVMSFMPFSFGGLDKRTVVGPSGIASVDHAGCTKFTADPRPKRQRETVSRSIDMSWPPRTR